MKRVKCRMLKMSHDIFKVQQISIKFLVKSGKTGAEIMAMLNNVYGEVLRKNHPFMMGLNVVKMVEKT